MRSEFTPSRAALVLCALSTLLGASLAYAQSGPAGGTIALRLTPSRLEVPAGTDFTVDLGIDMTAATGSCSTGGPAVPMTIGAYILGVQYDGGLLKFVSAAACPTTPAQMNPPGCLNNTNTPSASFVNCTSVNSSSTNFPVGDVCVARLTFTKLTAGPSSVSSLMTLHTGGARSIATELYAGCGGPITFPAGKIIPYPAPRPH